MIRPAILIIALTTIAHAQPGATPSAPPQQDYVVEETSYPLQIFVPSATSIALFAAGAMAEGPNGEDTSASKTMMSVGLVGMIFAPAIVHAIHGRYQRGSVSVLLRFGLGLAVGAYQVSTATCDAEELLCGADKFGPGVAIGVGIASLIDTIALTHEVRMRRVGPTWSPVITPARGGGQLGVVASF